MNRRKRLGRALLTVLGVAFALAAGVFFIWRGGSEDEGSGDGCGFDEGESCGGGIQGGRLNEEIAAAQYDTIPLRTRIGRMFIVGLDSTALKPNDPIISKIQEQGAGGVILFGHNIPVPSGDSTSSDRLKALCSRLQSLSGHELLIGTDQEGGRVMRLNTRKGYPDIPSHSHLGTLDSEDSTRHYASMTAEIMNGIGLNMNFAPCVDVDVNPSCPVIGKVNRSFSASPAKVAEHASYFIEEHRRHNVRTALKHFPGHGSSVSDSHMGITDISATWDPSELEPFRILIDDGSCDMVMVGHLFNSRIDSLYPASLSAATVQGLIRDELGWNGVVISDDIGMKAVSGNYSLEESLLLTINAGIDMIMHIAGTTPETLPESIAIVERLVLEGQIPESRITESYARIERTFK